MNRNTNFIVNALLQCSNAGKQILGQRIASFLGLTPGPRGSDDGIDGFLIYQGRTIHFQSKLRSSPLDREDARSYFSDIIFHKAKVSILLSGVGYKETFHERLFGHEGINDVSVYLLKLEDVIEQTDEFKRACNELPSLIPLDELLKKTIG